MPSIDCALLTDGPSDAVLTRVLEWTLQRHLSNLLVQCEWADLRRLPSRPITLADKVRMAAELYPCEVLFIHRDAENQPVEWRYDEIGNAVSSAREAGFDIPHVCVVPVRMQEAWLLLDEYAIRRAAGNPNGRQTLLLPQPQRIEDLPDPKDALAELLREASGLSGRRLKRFSAPGAARRVTEYMTAFACLRVLPAFRRLEADVESLVPSIQSQHGDSS